MRLKSADRAMVAATTVLVVVVVVADVGILVIVQIAWASDGRTRAMTTLQTKLLAQTEDRPLNLEEIRQWLQMRNLLEYLRQQKEAKRNVLPAVSEIMDDEMDAMDLDLEAYRQAGSPSFGWDYGMVEDD